MTQTVSAGNQARSLGTLRAGCDFSVYNPMHNESSLLQEHHDLSRRNFMQAGLLNRNEITWKDGRHHAGACDTQANAAERADYLSRQSTRQLNGSIPPVVGSHVERPATRLWY